MKDIYQKLIKQIETSSKDGIFGNSALYSSKEYENMPYDTTRLSKFIRNLSQEVFSTESEEVKIVQYFWKILVRVYRDCKKIDPNVSMAYLNSFIEDYPGVPSTALTLQLNSLTYAIFANKSVAYSNDIVLVWQQYTRLFREYSEFLNGLLGYLIIACKCAQNKPYKSNVFKTAFAAKAHQFAELTNGDSGDFYLFHRIIKPRLRNAIAHSKCWLDQEDGRVRYIDGKDEAESHISVADFLGLCMIGANLPRSYIAALSTIILWEFGSEIEKSSLPPNLLKLLTN